MRKNIEIDDKLMKKAMRAGGFTTKRATVENALQFMVDIKSQIGIRKLRGKFNGKAIWSSRVSCVSIRPPCDSPERCLITHLGEWRSKRSPKRAIPKVTCLAESGPTASLSLPEYPMLHHVLTHTVSILSAFFFMAVAPAIVAIRVRPSEDEGQN